MAIGDSTLTTELLAANLKRNLLSGGAKFIAVHLQSQIIQMVLSLYLKMRSSWDVPSDTVVASALTTTTRIQCRKLQPQQLSFPDYVDLKGAVG